MGLTTKEIGSSSFNDMISSVDRRSEYVENRANANVTLNNFLTPYTLDNKSSILNAPCGYSNGTYASLRPIKTFGPELVTNGTFDTDSDWNKDDSWSISGGKANYDYISGRNLNSSTTTLIVGKTYQIEYTISNYISGSVENSSAETQISNNSNGTYTEVFTARYTFLRFRGSTNGEFSIDNVSVKQIQEADFDFSRGSSATRVNEKGLIEDVQILSGELVQNGDFEEIGSELVTNGNFDTDSNWQKANAVIEDGVAKFQESVGTFSRVRQDTGYTGQAKVTYTISFNNTSATTMQLRSYGGGMINNAIPATVGTHTLYVNFTSNGISFQSGNFASGEEIHLDNVSVKEVGQNWTFQGGWNMGDGVALVNNASSGNQIYQSLLTIGKSYRATFEIKSITEGGFKLLFGGGAITSDNFNTVGVHTVDFVATADRFGVRTFSTTTGSIDNISLLEITDDTDIPRIDYTDGTGALLLEPQSTNKLTYSEDFSQWNLGTGTTVEFGYLSPDGTNNAYKVSGSSGALNLAGIANETQTRTIYARTVSGTGNAHLCSYFGNTNNLFTITPKWQRFEVNGTTTSTGATSFYAVDFRGSTDLTELIIWGAQTEELSYATSYIPTEGSTVTRNADVANNSGNADLINSTEGVLYAEILKKQDNNDSYILISLNNDASNADDDSVTLGFDASDDFYFRVKSNDSDVLISDNITSNKNQFYKVAVKYKSGDCAVWIDGVEQVTSTNSFTFGQTLDNLSFDFNGNERLPFYGKVKSLAVFKEALTDDELAQITSATQQEVFYEMRNRMNIKNYDYYEFGDYTTRLKKLF